MKKMMILLLAIGWVTMSSTGMAAMSNSAVRKHTLFLSDRMAYELNLTNAQYNDIYEINYDFVDAVRYIMDDVVRGNERAMDQYYYFLDIRNDDLRWVLSSAQYRRFMANETFYRPVYTSGSSWNFRVYISYSNHNYFYFGKPYHYRTYKGNNRRTSHTVASSYRNKYNHTVFNGNYSVRNEQVYVNNRRSDFGGNTTSSSAKRPAATTSSRRSVSANDDVYAPSRNTSGTGSSSVTSRRTTTGSSTGTSTGSSSSSGSSSSVKSTGSSSSGSSSSSRRSTESSSSSSKSSSSSSGSRSSSTSSRR